MFNYDQVRYKVRTELMLKPADFAPDMEIDDYIQETVTKILESGKDLESLPTRYFVVSAGFLVLSTYAKRTGYSRHYKKSSQTVVSLDKELASDSEGFTLQATTADVIDVEEEALISTELDELIEALGTDESGLMLLLSSMGYGREELKQASGWEYRKIATRLWRKRGELLGKNRSGAAEAREYRRRRKHAQ